FRQWRMWHWAASYLEGNEIVKVAQQARDVAGKHVLVNHLINDAWSGVADELDVRAGDELDGIAAKKKDSRVGRRIAAQVIEAQ
ncbi:MAG: hypothetical protein U0531_16280, partial [Dehalococcoidia bacterium]